MDKTDAEFDANQTGCYGWYDFHNYPYVVHDCPHVVHTCQHYGYDRSTIFPIMPMTSSHLVHLAAWHDNVLQFKTV